MALRRPVPQVRSRQEVVGLMLFLSPDENHEALAGCNDVAVLKAWVVHSPLARCFGLLLFGRGRNYRLDARVCDKFFGPVARVLDPLLPLLTGQRGVGKIF